MDHNNFENYSQDDENSASVMDNEFILKDKKHNDHYNTNSNVRSEKNKWKKYIAITSLLLFIIIISLVLIFGSYGSANYNTGNKIAVIYLQGTIVSGSMPNGMGYVSSDEISSNIRKAVDDSNVKAIVLRINSPGGSAAAGEEIYSEVKKARQKGKPVVVSMADVAASAAYHISAPANVIYASPSTMTGSIGAIWTFQNKSKYYDQEGIDFYIAKSGEFKDMGSDARGLNQSEKDYANSVIAEVYENFVNNVAQERNMSVDQVKNIADGRVYTGKKAQEIGLIDELGDMYDAIDKAKSLGNIEGEPNIIYVNKLSISNLLFGSTSIQIGVKDNMLDYNKNNPYGYISS